MELHEIGKGMQVCFIGHRTILNSEELIRSLKETIIYLINKGATNFLFGSMSEFDNLAWKIVTEYKTIYPNIIRVYVRASFEHINKSYEQYLLQSYDDTYFPEHISKAGKYAYVERNYEMINNSSVCVFYYNKNYIPQINPYNYKATILKRNSGTKIAYQYAVKKKKKIINLFEE